MAKTASSQNPFEVGQSYFFRTVTYHLVGTVTATIGDFLVLEDASWVADSGRFAQALQKATLAEVEPVGKAFLSLSSITDAFPWVHALPNCQI